MATSSSLVATRTIYYCLLLFIWFIVYELIHKSTDTGLGTAKKTISSIRVMYYVSCSSDTDQKDGHVLVYRLPARLLYCYCYC